MNETQKEFMGLGLNKLQAYVATLLCFRFMGVSDKKFWNMPNMAKGISKWTDEEAYRVIDGIAD